MEEPGRNKWYRLVVQFVKVASLTKSEVFRDGRCTQISAPRPEGLLDSGQPFLDPGNGSARDWQPLGYAVRSL